MINVLYTMQALKLMILPHIHICIPIGFLYYYVICPSTQAIQTK